MYFQLSIFSCQILGTDAMYRVIIDPPREVVAIITAVNCSRETCYYAYHSNTVTDTSTVTVDVVGCTITRPDSRNISTCKSNLLTSPHYYVYVYLVRLAFVVQNQLLPFPSLSSTRLADT